MQVPVPLEEENRKVILRRSAPSEYCSFPFPPNARNRSFPDPPALDEARRLPPYLESVRAYLEQSFRQPYEVIVVDDGSRDETAAVVEGLASRVAATSPAAACPKRGQGSRRADRGVGGRGELLLFADADGATPIEEHARLAAAIARGADVAIGSRLAPDPAIRRSRHWYRGLAGKFFALAARRLLRISVLDTQCGFKMFRAAAGRRLFAALRETRYLFDLETSCAGAEVRPPRGGSADSLAGSAGRASPSVPRAAADRRRTLAAATAVAVETLDSGWSNQYSAGRNRASSFDARRGGWDWARARGYREVEGKSPKRFTVGQRTSSKSLLSCIPRASDCCERR